jgi:lipid A 4'-phosphatase
MFTLTNHTLKINTKLHLISGACLLIFTTIIFLTFPQWDLEATHFFYSNDHFFYGESFLVFLIKNSLPWLVNFFLSFLVICLLAHFLKSKWLKISLRSLLFCLLSLILAPGLLVNSLLKQHWSRPRPYQTLDFGGSYFYQKIWVMGHHATSSCSFVCGHCSGAFAFICLIPITPPRHRIWVCMAVFVYAILIGLARLAQGAHYLSDIMLAYCIDYIVITALYWLVFRKKNTC